MAVASSFVWGTSAWYSASFANRTLHPAMPVAGGVANWLSTVQALFV